MGPDQKGPNQTKKKKKSPDWKWALTKSGPKPKVGIESKWAPYQKLAPYQKWAGPKVSPDQKKAPTKSGPPPYVGPNQKCWS